MAAPRLRPTPRSTSSANLAGTDPVEEMLTKLAHLNLTGKVEQDDTVMHGRSGFGDVFVGKSNAHGGRTVVIRRLRVHLQQEPIFATVSS